VKPTLHGDMISKLVVSPTTSVSRWKGIGAYLVRPDSMDLVYRKAVPNPAIDLATIPNLSCLFFFKILMDLH
jgi:hypothetical protein